MERFVFWTGGSYVNATCKDCDYRIIFESNTPGDQVQESLTNHDCLRDG